MVPHFNGLLFPRFMKKACLTKVMCLKVYSKKNQLWFNVASESIINISWVHLVYIDYRTTAGCLKLILNCITCRRSAIGSTE